MRRLRRRSFFPPVLAAALLCRVAPGRVLLDAPGHVCVEGARVAARGGEPGSGWTLLDWRGRAVGTAGVFDEQGETALPPLPAGYYRIVGGVVTAPSPSHDCAADDGAPSPRQLATLAVVAPPEARRAEDVGFMALDTAQSWCAADGKFECPWNGGDAFRTICDLVALSGIRHVRDRFSWAKASPAQGVFEYGENLRNAQMLRDDGVGVSEPVFHTPRRMASADVRRADLAAIRDSCARMAADMGDLVECWECWNELDLKGAPAWDDAAAQKAAYLGFKAGNPGAVVLPASMSGRPGQAYMRTLFDNDIAKYGDAINFHTYLPISEYPGLFATLRRFLSEHGACGRAIWMTETGTNVEGPAARKGHVRGIMAHSPEQELLVAEFFPKSQIAMRMEGVARAYGFLLCPYNERGGKKDWGMMRRDGTVKPAYAAMATLARELGAANLVGELKVGGGIRAFLFDQPDGSQTVAFWSESPIDTATGSTAVSPEPGFAREWRLELPGGYENNPCRLADMCGMVSPVAATNGTLVLPATRFPVYLSGLHGLVADVPSVPAGRAAPCNPDPDQDLTVILRVDLNDGDFAVSNHKSLAQMTGSAGGLRVEVWNLGDTVKTGRVDVAGATLSGLPETIVLGPRGEPPPRFDCTLESPDDGSTHAALVLAGIFNGRRSSRLAIPVLFEKNLHAGCERVALDWRDPNRWSRNDSAERGTFVWDEDEQAVRWDFEWTDFGSDRWAYPIYSLAKDLGERLDGAVAFRFEAKSDQDKVENDFSDSVCMLVAGDGREEWIRYPEPVKTWETRTVALDGRLEPAAVAAIRLGANPKGMKMTLWLKNLEIMRK